MDNGVARVACREQHFEFGSQLQGGIGKHSARLAGEHIVGEQQIDTSVGTQDRQRRICVRRLDIAVPPPITNRPIPVW
jgi:hypothetical protein